MKSDDSKTMKFEILRNDSMNTVMGGTSGTDITFPPMQLYNEDGTENHSSIVGYSAHTGETINIKDAYKEKALIFPAPKILIKPPVTVPSLCYQFPLKITRMR